MIDQNIIAKKIEDLIKQKITDDGLVKTGAMRDSIKVFPVAGGFDVSAVPYFLYLNSEYKIMEEVVNSSEFNTWLSNYLNMEIQQEFNNLNK